MPGDIRTRVDEFFASYQAAFEGMQAGTIADLFAYPLQITSDSGEISLSVIETREAWIEQVEQLLKAYRTVGLSSARILDLATNELSPRLVQAVVHWELQNSAGGVLYDFKTMYTLVLIQDRFRIAAIAHDEIPKLRASLQQLKSG